jgi:hypothetical protein
MSVRRDQLLANPNREPVAADDQDQRGRDGIERAV